MSIFLSTLFEQPALYVATVASYMGSICVHEYSHAFVAHRMGDNTAKEGGYLTLNPFKVMGWLSMIALLLFGFSWGAVPVMREDSNRLRRSAIALAGPLSNLVLLILSAVLLKILYSFPAASVTTPGTFLFYIRLVLVCLLYANAILFLFNILPIPRLDGWGIIEPYLPKSLIPSLKVQTNILRVFIYLVCFSSASGIFEKGLEMFASKFLPSQVSALALVSEGNECMEAGDFNGAFKAYCSAAEQGSPEGMLNYAACLAEGYGCEKNAEKAFSEFSKPEVCGYPLAKFYLGLMYMNGIGVATDYEKAYSYLSDSEVQNQSPIARANLGMLLSEGLGVEADNPRAYSLLNDETVMAVSPIARYYMACYLLGGEVCPRNEKRAVELLNDKEVLETFPFASFLLGLAYYAGNGTTQDFRLAAEFLKRAADAGNPEAMQFLGYQNGRLPDYGIPLEELLKQLWESNM